MKLIYQCDKTVSCLFMYPTPIGKGKQSNAKRTKGVIFADYKSSIYDRDAPNSIHLRTH